MELGQEEESARQSQVPSPAGNLGRSFPDPQREGHDGERNSPPMCVLTAQQRMDGADETKTHHS